MYILQKTFFNTYVEALNDSLPVAIVTKCFAKKNAVSFSVLGSIWLARKLDQQGKFLY